MNFSNQALFQERLDDLFDIITYHNAISLIKLKRIGCFCSLSVRKGVYYRRKMCGVERALALKGTTSSETQNSSSKLCIENMFNNTCSNNYITASLYAI